jgi:hypothetical protein
MFFLSVTGSLFAVRNEVRACDIAASRRERRRKGCIVKKVKILLAPCKGQGHMYSGAENEHYMGYFGDYIDISEVHEDGTETHLGSAIEEKGGFQIPGTPIVISFQELPAPLTIEFLIA